MKKFVAGIVLGAALGFGAGWLLYSDRNHPEMQSIERKVNDAERKLNEVVK